MSTHHYEETTRNIRISVEPNFLEDQSEPEDRKFLWSYHVRIENKSDVAVQLLSRYWRITDSEGRTREVRGDGVIGEQPLIEPGGAYEYVSGAPLPTASGFMTGSYRMRMPNGESFEASIPMFALLSPYGERRMH